MVLGLQDAWLAAWAKSAPFPPAEVEWWLPLHQHLDDSGAVAGLLVDHWVPGPVLHMVANEVGGVERARRLVCWLAGVHDVGKVSPAFAVQVTALCGRMRDSGLVVRSELDGTDVRARVNHALVGHVAVADWLVQRGFDDEVAVGLASVVGSHHGMTPEWVRLAEVEEQVDYSGSGVWEQARFEVLERAAERYGLPEPTSALSTPVLALLTAVVIVADWIASNDDYFPLWSLGEFRGPDDALTRTRAAEAWQLLRLPGRWKAPVPGDVGETFAARFGRPAEDIRDVQAGAVAAAREMKGRGLLVVEAPMGRGKTEAALLAAEVLAHASGADGCFVALPTQATTDAMFGRVRSWLDRVPGGATLTLAHGKAHLNDEYAGLVRKGRFETGCGATAHEWLRGRKRAGLASFVVGTIDQVLFAGLKAKHVMLRHLSLAGKVVVIDEVHAYDVYMSRYLHRVLHWLGVYGVPVVLLSATLPDARRADLLAAYDGGVRGPVQHPGYPAITGTAVEPRAFPLQENGTEVALDHLDDDLPTLTSYLDGHLADGGCAVVVRNTVSRVQETADHLVAAGFDVTVNHARFLACDRARLDRGLLARFGPPSPERVRPHKHVVVASQVVEQSLDVDFDLMVTDLAPVDLVLQRMGRLHRHHRPDRTKAPRCALTGAEWSASPPDPVKGSSKVYDDHHLLRAAALLDRPSITLPHDIARLVQDAYGDTPLGPEDWQPAMTEARRKAEEKTRTRWAAARTYLLPEAGRGDLVDWLRGHADDVGDGSPRGTAQVRDGGESLEVLVVQGDGGGGLCTPDWIDGGGEQIPLLGEVPWPLAKRISACSLRLPYALCHPGIIDSVIDDLERRTKVSSFQETSALKGELVLELDEHRQTELCGFLLTYDPIRGLLHDRV